MIKKIKSAENKQTFANTGKKAQETIQGKAYELYERRGCAHGNDLGDWFEAERAVLGRKN